MKKISVITVCLNNDLTIRDSICSVLSQNYNNFEYLIIDGGSSDQTISIIADYQNRLSHFISEHDNGIYHALNKGINLSTGESICFLHADDVFANKDVLQNIANVFEKNSTLDCVYSDLYYVRRNNLTKIVRYWKSCPFSKSLLNFGWMPPHPTMFIKRSWYDHLGLYDTKYRISSDYEFILRSFLSPSFKSKYFPKCTVKMRIGGESNKSFSAIFLKIKEDCLALKKNNFNYFYIILIILFKNISKLPQFIRINRA